MPCSVPVAVALVAAAVSHVPVIPAHLREAPYLGVSFVAFTVLAVGLAVGIVARGSRRWFLAAGALCVASLVAYCATRLVAFPQVADDVGNWREPAGVAAVVSELSVLLLLAGAIGQPGRRTRRPGRSSLPFRTVSARLAAGTAVVVGLASVVVLPAGASTSSDMATAIGAGSSSSAAASGTPTLAKFTEQLPLGGLQQT